MSIAHRNDNWEVSFRMKKDYRTISKNGTTEETIRKSRFICHLSRTDTEEEAIAFIESIKKEQYKATHNCSAYLIGENNEIQRAHDDGEPSGTAGVPMLEVLKKNELKNVTAVVTRYFGGIKLGAGGLIRAYGSAVSGALAEIGLVEKVKMREVHVTVPYPLSGRIENELRESDFLLQDILYTEAVTFVCLVKMNEQAVFEERFTELSNGQASFAYLKETFIESSL